MQKQDGKILNKYRKITESLGFNVNLLVYVKLYKDNKLNNRKNTPSYV